MKKAQQKNGFTRVLSWMTLGLILLLIPACSPLLWEEESLAAMEVSARRLALLDSNDIYFGNLHSHTRYSDGEGSPWDTLAWARDVAGYDFYAVTDHSELVSGSEWSNIGRAVADFTQNGSFIGIRGFEWSHPFRGHINVFGTSSYKNFFSKWSLGSFYNWIRDNNGIGQWNHPGDTAWPGDFNNLKVYNTNHIPYMNLMETGNGGDGNNDEEYERYYIKALDRGYKCGPANNQDNHSMSGNSHRTAIIAPELSQAALFQAIRDKRTYSTDDPDIQVIYKAGDAFLGSTLDHRGSILFQIHVEDNEPIQKIELVTKGGYVVATQTFEAGTTQAFWEPTMSVSGPCYAYAKIYSQNTLEPSDGPVQVAITAPIWFE